MAFYLPLEDLVTIYNSYIRSILEYNSNVWFSSISNEERENIERVQRVACKIILKDDFIATTQVNLKQNHLEWYCHNPTPTQNEVGVTT